MNRRVVTFWILYFIKVNILILVIIPVIMFWSSLAYEYLYKTALHPTAYDLTYLVILLFATIQLGDWFRNHKDNVDRYYDEQEGK